jgi:hypothetical protein
MHSNILHARSSGKRFTEFTVEMQAGETTQMSLGVYTTSEPKPEFDKTVTPDIGDQLGLSREELAVPGGPRYILFYNLHNFSDKPCEVTVRRRGAAAQA